MRKWHKPSLVNHSCGWPVATISGVEEGESGFGSGFGTIWAGGSEGGWPVASISGVEEGESGLGSGFRSRWAGSVLGSDGGGGSDKAGNGELHYFLF